jgi:hypothetical protein
MLRIDHVVLAVRDLEASAERLSVEHGLRFVAGGRHPRWGTANMIAPLGGEYVELLSVVDERVGSETALGKTLMELSVDGDRWFSVCLADDDIDSTAARLGLTVRPGARTRPDGTEVRWRSAGIEDRGQELWLPFFIAWDGPPELHPGAVSAEHRVDPDGIAWAEVGGEEALMRDWLGGADVPIRVVDDADRRLRAVGISLRDGREIVIRA